MKITREWSMPNHETFSIPPINDFVIRYMYGKKISVDPFSRNKKLATYTNDLNKDTCAQYHLEAGDFLDTMRHHEIKADIVLFDPPYSPRQISECYKHIGKDISMSDTQSKTWSVWKNKISDIVPIGGVVLSFGWNSVGMGKKHGFEILEILLVCHGGMHNDTICVAEVKKEIK